MSQPRGDTWEVPASLMGQGVGTIDGGDQREDAFERDGQLDACGERGEVSKSVYLFGQRQLT